MTLSFSLSLTLYRFLLIRPPRPRALRLFTRTETANHALLARKQTSKEQ